MESLTPEVQEAGDQCKSHQRPGCQSVVVTCLHCLCGQQSLIYHCLCNFILEITFFSCRKNWRLNAIWQSVTKHSSDPMKRKHEGEKKSFEELCCAYKTEYPYSSEICTEIFRGK